MAIIKRKLRIKQSCAWAWAVAFHLAWTTFLVPFAARGQTVDLSDLPSSFPYQWERAAGVSDLDGMDQDELMGSLLLDLDGDGYEERVSAIDVGIVADDWPNGMSRNLWQFNLPPQYSWNDRCASLDCAGDINGDGIPEIIINSHPEDRSHWRIWALNVASMDTIGITLPPGPDNWADGAWDGRYWVVGVSELAVGNQVKPVYVVAVDSGLDLEPRGLFAVDPYSGEEVWRFMCGPRLNPRNTLMIDLDGDGKQEIVFKGIPTRNLKGRLVNGTTDDHPIFFVVEQDGSLRWSHEFPLAGPGLGYDFFDVNGDGVQDIVVSTNLQGEKSKVSILGGADGQVLSEFPVSDFASKVKISPTIDGEGYDVWLVSERSLFRLSGKNGSLSKVGKIVNDHGIRGVLAADVVDAKGWELIISDFNGNLFLLSNDLEPLAHYPDGNPFVGTVDQWRPDVGHHWIRLIGRINAGVDVMKIARSPAKPLQNIWLVGLALTAGLGGVFLVRSRSPKSVAALPRREARLRLLEALELSSHGAIGALQVLRRLTWLTSTLSTSEGAADRIIQKIRVLSRECRTQAIPELRQILELGHHCGLNKDSLQNASGAIDRIDSALREGFDGLPDSDRAESVVGRLRSAGREAEESLQELRFEVNGYFSADLSREWEKVLGHFSDQLEDLGVEVDRSGLVDSNLILRIDAQELSFILDNLVGNAIRAMEESTVKKLILSGGCSLGMVECDVEDTGCGIFPDDWDRIMEPGASTREDGGLGLHRSVKILRKYSGTLKVVASEPGNGTTLRLKIPGLKG